MRVECVILVAPVTAGRALGARRSRMERAMTMDWRSRQGIGKHENKRRRTRSTLESVSPSVTESFI